MLDPMPPSSLSSVPNSSNHNKKEEEEEGKEAKTSLRDAMSVPQMVHAQCPLISRQSSMVHASPSRLPYTMRSKMKVQETTGSLYYNKSLKEKAP